ncbi:MAG: pyridoxamine 5'-phosphate oxidase family protein [Deltaproteobacteria bacterium]|nr:pyridoxamine 5'-phosphate oxidase family protein [Deltaproteobacteria bacterium]
MRKHRSEVTDPVEIRRILESTNIGRLATIGEDGYPYITPVNFVFHQGCVYFHCALEGEKLDNIRRIPRVCFEVDVPLAYLDIGFDPSRPACHLHQFYHCVIIRGTASLVRDVALKVDALNALIGKHEPGKPFAPVTEETPQARACEVVEVRPETTTAKSDLAQGKDEEFRKRLVRYFAGRGLPGDAETVKAMGE